MPKYRLLETFPELQPFEGDIDLRMQRYAQKRSQLLGSASALSEFANAHHYYGFHRTNDGWYYREWAPAADMVYLTGDFNSWQWTAAPLTRLDNGSWACPGIPSRRAVGS